MNIVVSWGIVCVGEEVVEDIFAVFGLEVVL